MSLTPSSMLELGTKAPNFDLLDVKTGKKVKLDDFEGKKGLLVMFICRHCPFVVHIQEELAALGRDYEGQDVGMVAICANDAENYPDDAPDLLKKQAEELDFRFPYCYDESQEVAKAYTAACTPDFFLFDAQNILVYRGQMDASRPGNGIPVTGKDLRAAIHAVLNDQPVSQDQKPSIGCNIKWRS